MPLTQNINNNTSSPKTDVRLIVFSNNIFTCRSRPLLPMRSISNNIAFPFYSDRTKNSKKRKKKETDEYSKIDREKKKKRKRNA